jgi:hypothetical protein
MLPTMLLCIFEMNMCSQKPDLGLLTFQSLLVTGCTNKFNILTTVRSAHTVFMCFVFV